LQGNKAVDVEVASPNSSTTTGSLAPRSSRPASPHFGSSSSYDHSPHPPQQEQREEEDLGFESNDIVTCINLSIPQSSTYPYSASDATSPTATPPRSSSPTLQHAILPLSTNSLTSQPTSSASPSLSSHPTVTPSHDHEPIFILHRIKWIIFIHNKDGHVSELRCSLPIRILDGAFLEESRGFTMRFRRLLLRTSGLGNGGEEGSEDEGVEGEGVDEGRIRQMEADRELPSYPAHVRDRVANMYLSDAATMPASNNPSVGGSGASALSTPELPGQRELSPLIPAIVLPSDPVSATLHFQPDSRASRSGHTTPDIHMMSNLLDNEAVRRIGNILSSLSGQQQQSQPHQHQHQTHDQQHQQHSRTFRWGSRVGSGDGSRAASPEHIALTNNSDNGFGPISEGGSPNSVVPHSSSQSPGFASPFQHLFKATIKPFTALAGHRPMHSLSRSTTSLMGLPGTQASDLSAGAATNSGQPSALNADSRRLSSGGAGQIFLSTPSRAPQNETNGLIFSDSPSSNPSLAANVPSSSSLSESGLQSSTPASTSASASPLSQTISRAFSLVPDYNIASRGFVGGIPPLSSTRGLPSYEEAEAQRKERAKIQSQMQQTRLPIQNQGQTTSIQTQTQTQTQTQNQVVDGEEKMINMKTKMKGRGSMSEPDLAGRFGVRFESGTQAVAQTEAGTFHSMQSGTSGGVGIVQRSHDGEDDEDDDDDGDEDDTGAGPIQMRISKR
jgi:arrestin-related trafficking adapter 4/5/7